jgi:large-conductance mechanosensitive channel
MEMLKGFRNFLMRGDVVVVAVGLVVALAFSNLVKAFTDNIINPLIAAAQGGVKGSGLGWQLVSGEATAHSSTWAGSSRRSSTSSSLWRSCIS